MPHGFGENLTELPENFLKESEIRSEGSIFNNFSTHMGHK
jgi:hypothetical protein